MKILYVVTKGNWGGAQRYVYDLACAARGRGFDTAVALGQPGLLAEKLAAAGIATHVVASFGRDIALGADIRSFFEVYRLLKKERPDVVHLNSSKAAGIGALAARLLGIRRIVFTDHGWAFEEKRGIPARAAIWLLSWLTALMCDRIICVSRHELRATERMPFCARKAALIYNGIDLTMQFGSGDIIRGAFPPDAAITGTIGELTRNKNQSALIEEARRNPGMYVAIVGEGELRGELERKIREYRLESRVKLFGFVPAREALKGFDRFALPSQKEALGYALLEARAAGLPIDASRAGGMSEALELPLQTFSLKPMVEQTFALYAN